MKTPIDWEYEIRGCHDYSDWHSEQAVEIIEKIQIEAYNQAIDDASSYCIPVMTPFGVSMANCDYIHDAYRNRIKRLRKPLKEGE